MMIINVQTWDERRAKERMEVDWKTRKAQFGHWFVRSLDDDTTLSDIDNSRLIYTRHRKVGS